LGDKKAVYFLAGLVAVRLIMVAVLIGLNWPPMAEHQGWFFRHGGDQQEYIRLSLSLVRQEPVFSFVNIGFPLFIAPFLWLSGGQELNDILPSVVLFNVCFLASASIVLEYLIARQLTGNRKAALFAAGLWVFLPYVLYGANLLLRPFRPQWCKPLVLWSALYMWVQVLSDGLAAFVVMAFIYALTRSLDPLPPGESQRARGWALLSGLLAGLGFLLRPVNMVLFVLAAGIYLWQRAWRRGLYFAGAAAFAAIPQFMYDTLYSESRFRAAVVESAQGLSGQASAQTPLFSFRYVTELLERLYLAVDNPLIFAALLFLVAGGFFVAIRYIARRDRAMAGVLVSWVLLYLALYALYFAFQWDVIRHLMPVMPAAMIVIAIDAAWLRDRLRPSPLIEGTGADR
jgi:4-amino-4-deoxy-L-arabinose transferase-like glycosyltransferase